jgi:hypothetical protein
LARQLLRRLKIFDCSILTNFGTKNRNFVL